MDEKESQPSLQYGCPVKVRKGTFRFLQELHGSHCLLHNDDDDALQSQIASANAVNRADEKVQQAYKNSRDGIVVLPCYLPWKNGLYKTDALFVVYPSQRGGWSAQCVTDHKTKRPKLPFPQSWAGQPQEVIEQKSGIPGISFCHASRFLITAKDKETALAACRQVLKNNGRI